MRRRFARVVPTLALAVACLAQVPLPPEMEEPDKDKDLTLPSGKSQRDEILKAEHQQNLKDAAQLINLSQQLKQDLENNDRYVLSLDDLKKIDDIEKLAKKIRARMRHD